MKKVTSLLMAIFCAVTFSMAAFADSAEVQPRAAECPFCGSNGWSVTRVGRRANGSTEVSCTHYQYGTDVITKYIVDYSGSCYACGQTQATQSTETELVLSWTFAYIKNGKFIDEGTAIKLRIFASLCTFLIP